MTVAEEMRTFNGMCERIGINPSDGLDMLLATPNGLPPPTTVSALTEIPGGIGGARPVYRYMSAGPGPPA